MDRNETHADADADMPCRALVVIPSRDDRDMCPRRVTGRRPMAGFLTQLIVDTNPSLRTARSERTRTAAALYARAAGSPGGRRRA